MGKRYSNKNELQKQLITIYDNFKNGIVSNRQLKKANNILNILDNIANTEIDEELKKYIYDNRLKSKLFVKACKPTLKCHLKYCFNYPQDYKTRLKKANKDIKKAITSDIKQDDFDNELNLDGKLINLSKKMASMQKLNTIQKVAKM